MTHPGPPHTCWFLHQSTLFISITYFLLLTKRTASEDEIITPRSWNHNFDTGMYFLQHPVSQILEKSEAKATIHCTAVSAITVSIRCADQSFLSDKSIPPVSVNGQSSISVSAEIDRNSIEKVREEGLPCVCEAKNLTSTLRSEPALLQLAHLKRLFREEPHPIQRVKIGTSAEICAQPPEGVPEPTVYWEKDGKILDPENEQSVSITIRNHNKHCLIFSLVTEHTQGSYRCVAQNLVSNRTSLPSKLLVYLDGGWSDWSAWSECNITCGLGSSIRSRYCNQPAPINDGKLCVGDAMETKQCTRLCQQDGNWSPWSEWNACNTQCVHHRTRKCNNPAPRNGGKDCVGETIDHANCSGGHCNQNYMSKNPFSGAPGAKNGDPRGSVGSGSPDGTSREGSSPGGDKDGGTTDDIFLYTFAMVTTMLLFVAMVMSGLFLCYKKYKYICRITGGSHTAATTAETSLCHHPHVHTLAMEAHHQQRTATSYSPSGLYVTKSHNGNIVTRVLGGTGAPPDVTQTQQTVQILSDGTFYKTMYVDPNVVPAAPSSGNGSMPPTSVAFLAMNEEGGSTPPGSQQGYTPTSVVPPNKRCSPSRCSSTALYSKTDTAVTMLSDQSSVSMFCKNSCGAGGVLGNEDMQMYPNGTGQPHHRMYENTGNHYQSIKDIDSDASHYHSLPFQNGPSLPMQSANQKTGPAPPIQPIIQIRQGVVLSPSDCISRHCAQQAAALGGNVNAGCLSPYQEESDYFSQCSSEGCSASGGFGNGFMTESDCTTYHIDLCRSPISPENCITCNKSFH